MNDHAPSLLDKLLGARPAGRDGPGRCTLEQVKDSVARDIEMLLNAQRCFSAEELAPYPHASRSLLSLGLVDISSLSLASDADRRRITDAIRDGLMAHDRRLSEVEVGVRPLDASAGGLTFTIRARLLLKSNVERVVFDATLHAGSKRYDVSRAGARPARPLA